MNVHWDVATATRIDDASSLDRVLAIVRACAEPTMVFLESETGRVLVVGIGSEETVLTFLEPDGASYHSVGDINRRGVLKFWCRDQIDDFRAQTAVPASSGVEAAKQFVATGERPDNVKWEADW